MTQWTPIPITLWGHAAFNHLLQSWGIDHNLAHQQDASEFLQHVLVQLMPNWYDASWLPLWGVHAPAAAEFSGEKGVRFSPLRMNINLITDGDSFDTLVHAWHDPLGHCRVLEHYAAGVCIQISRLENDDNPRLCTKLLRIGRNVALPIHQSEAKPKWISFDIVAVTLHHGHIFLQGHYTTSLWHAGKECWFHYDDGRLPTIDAQDLTDAHCRQVVMQWLANSNQRVNLFHHMVSPVAAQRAWDLPPLRLVLGVNQFWSILSFCSGLISDGLINHRS